MTVYDFSVYLFEKEKDKLIKELKATKTHLDAKICDLDQEHFEFESRLEKDRAEHTKSNDENNARIQELEKIEASLKDSLGKFQNFPHSFTINRN